MSRLRSLLIVVIVLSAVAVTAQTPVVLERIEVNTGARIRPAIVRAEARLKPGRSYTKAQLDQAVYRIRRLPFVVEAHYALTSGNAPSTSVMTITVMDQERLNHDVSADIVGIHSHGGFNSVNSLGYNFFTGPAGLLDAGVGASTAGPSGSFSGLTLRYSAYGLFGTGAYAIGSIGSRAGLSPSILVGIPVGLTQTLQGTYQRNAKDSTDYSTSASAKWISDRTDDLYLPLRGVIVSVGPEWSKYRNVSEFNVGTRFFFRDDVTVERTGVVLAASPYRPIGDHSALWSRATFSRFNESELLNGKETPKVQETNAAIVIGLVHNFDGMMQEDNPYDYMRFRLEGGIGYRIANRIHSGVGNQREKDHGVTYDVGFSMRTRWGIIHFGADYTPY